MGDVAAGAAISSLNTIIDTPHIIFLFITGTLNNYRRTKSFRLTLLIGPSISARRKVITKQYEL